MVILFCMGSWTGYCTRHIAFIFLLCKACFCCPRQEFVASVLATLIWYRYVEKIKKSGLSIINRIILNTDLTGKIGSYYAPFINWIFSFIEFVPVPKTKFSLNLLTLILSISSLFSLEEIKS